MKVISKLAKVLFCLLILALLAAPLGLIYEISNREKRQYATPTAPDFVEMAYGTIAEAERRMPEDDYSPYVQQVLENLKANQYDGTVSFESKNGAGLDSMKKALQMLKETLEN